VQVVVCTVNVQNVRVLLEWTVKGDSLYCKFADCYSLVGFTGLGWNLFCKCTDCLSLVSSQQCSLLYSNVYSQTDIFLLDFDIAG
jgi:hypothetical protein